MGKRLWDWGLVLKGVLMALFFRAARAPPVGLLITNNALRFYANPVERSSLENPTTLAFLIQVAGAAGEQLINCAGWIAHARYR